MDARNTYDWERKKSILICSSRTHIFFQPVRLLFLFLFSVLTKKFVCSLVFSSFAVLAFDAANVSVLPCISAHPHVSTFFSRFIFCFIIFSFILWHKIPFILSYHITSHQSLPAFLSFFLRFCFTVIFNYTVYQTTI